jgi:serine/threonine protein kinase
MGGTEAYVLEQERFWPENCNKLGPINRNSEAGSDVANKNGGAPQPETIGKYQVERLLGRGGTSSVYLARDPFSARLVAIKVATPEVLHDPEFGAQYRKLFINEAGLAGKLRHPHIVRLLDAVVGEDQQYIVMEHLPGVTLEPYCRPDNLLEFDRVVDVIFKCSQALDYASRQGVVHRDIKPANIMFDHDGDIKLADFGAALSLRSTTTQIMGAVGSLAYMAPEQLRHEGVTHQTDIYSLGVVMFQLLTGQLPYNADNQAALIQKILNEPMPLVSDLRPDIPVALASIVLRATEKSLKDRYTSWREFIKDLGDTAGGLDTRSEEIDDTRKFQLLRGLSFFKDFNEVELWQALRITRWASFPKGKVLIQEGDIGRSFFVIVNGSAKVFKDKKLLGVFNEGDPFGEMVCVEDVPIARSGTVIADTNMVVVKIRKDSLLQAPDSLQLRFNRVLLRILASRLTTTASLYIKAK